MSITSTTTFASSASSLDRLSSIGTHQPLPLTNTQRFVFERYPKTSFEEVQSVVSEHSLSKLDLPSNRARHHLRFRTQPITLTEINETDEENKADLDSQSAPSPKTLEEFQRLDHLALSENIRRTARKKVPLKNYLERQRLKAMREEPSETDGNWNVPRHVYTPLCISLTISLSLFLSLYLFRLNIKKRHEALACPIAWDCCECSYRTNCSKNISVCQWSACAAVGTEHWSLAESMTATNQRRKADNGRDHRQSRDWGWDCSPMVLAVRTLHSHNHVWMPCDAEGIGNCVEVLYNSSRRASPSDAFRQSLVDVGLVVRLLSSLRELLMLVEVVLVVLRSSWVQRRWEEPGQRNKQDRNAWQSDRCRQVNSRTRRGESEETTLNTSVHTIVNRLASMKRSSHWSGSMLRCCEVDSLHREDYYYWWYPTRRASRWNSGWSDSVRCVDDDGERISLDTENTWTFSIVSRSTLNYRRAISIERSVRETEWLEEDLNWIEAFARTDSGRTILPCNWFLWYLDNRRASESSHSNRWCRATE